MQATIVKNVQTKIVNYELLTVRALRWLTL